MDAENIFGMSDEVMDKLEKQIAHAEIDSETSEDFITACFPSMSAEDKAKASLFAEKFAELFLDDDEDEE